MVLDNRFSQNELDFLKDRGVPESFVNSFDSRFSAFAIAEFHIHSADPRNVNAYPEHYSAEDILYFDLLSITPSDTQRYPTHYDGKGILWMHKLSVPLQTVSQYPIRFSGSEVAFLHLYGINPIELGEWNPSLSAIEIYDLIQLNFPPSLSKYYSDEIGVLELIVLRETGLLHKMDSLMGKDLIDAIITMKPSENELYLENLIGEYNAALLCSDPRQNVENLLGGRYDDLEDKLKRQLVIEYENTPPNDLDNRSVQNIADSGDSSLTKYYDKRFSSQNRTTLSDEGILPDIANSYADYFSCDDIIFFFDSGIPSVLANNFERRLSKDEILLSILHGVTPAPEGIADWQNYDERFGNRDVGNLYLGRVHPHVAIQFSQRFAGDDICELINNNVSADVANSYDDRFDSTDIISLHHNNVKPDIALEYSLRLSGPIIALMFKMNILPGDVSPEKENFIAKFIQKEINHSTLDSLDPESAFIGTGAGGVVLHNSRLQTAFKIGENLDNEKYLFRTYGNGKFKHVVNYAGIINEHVIDVIELEYIKGVGWNDFNDWDFQNSLKFGYDVLRGLIELRDAGIYYHHDIRPANIIIDQENDRAAIIDLGTATDDREKMYTEFNRRYGEDLVALGTMMYESITNEPLFVDSHKMMRTTYADNVKDERDVILGNPQLLEEHLNKVRRKISDKKVANLISECITAKPYHLGKIRRMFKKVGYG